MDAKAFGRFGDIIAENLKQGMPILVEGRLQYNTWKDKDTGATRSKLELHIENFSFVPDGKQNGQQGTRESTSNTLPPDASTSQAVPDVNDEIPF